MLRMNYMVSCLSLCAWIEAGRLPERSRIRDYWPQIVFAVLIGTSHSAGVVPASAVLLFCSPELGTAAWKTKFKTWLMVCGIVALLLSPWIVIGVFRHAASLSTATWAIVAHTVGGWALGYNYDLPDVWRRYAAVIVAALVGTSYALAPSVRRTILCFIVWPIVFVAVFSWVLKPLWYYRPFSFVCPFAAIAVGALVGRLVELAGRWDRRLSLVPAAAMAAMAGILLWIDWQELRKEPPAEILPVSNEARGIVDRQDARPGWPSEFVQISNYLRDRVRAGELVYVPDYRTFWGVARYVVGPEWGNAGSVQDPVDQDHSERWPRIYLKLGPERLNWLHLAPRTRRVDGFRAPLFIGWSPLRELESVRSFWEVEPIIKEGGFAIPQFAGCTGRQIEAVSFAGTRVFHVICSGS